MTTVMKRFFILMGTMLLVFASCSKDTVKVSNGDRAINFRTSVGTKAEATLTADLEEFVVTALNESNDIYFEDLLFTNEDNDNFFESEEVYYWPASGDLTFYAWAPTETEAGCEVVISATEKTLNNYAPAESIKDQIDLLYAVATGNNSNEAVHLEFGHALSQIELMAKNSNTNYVYTVRGVRIGSVAEAGSLNLETNEWSPVSTTETYESIYTSEEESVILTGTDANIMSAEGNAMLIPQQLTKWDVETDKANVHNGAYLAVYVNIKTVGNSQVFPKDGGYGWVAVPINTLWEPGKKYIYTLDFSTGAGYIAPDDDTNPGGSVLGTSIKFSLNTEVAWWQSGMTELQ